jgi:uncharacterized cofD-like protein
VTGETGIEAGHPSHRALPADSPAAADPAQAPRRLRVVALGGGHGLFASLSALRLLDVDITAVVTVADDGGSSGRIRRELGVLPPGDLRMALAALSSHTLTTADGVRTPWTQILQHRIGGSGALAGHPIGNLLLTGLLDMHDEPVRALDEIAELVGARGRVLPMSAAPLDLIAEVASVDPDDPVRERRIRGQSAIATTAGRVTSIRLVPADAAACPQAVTAILSADAVILGPGSWFTSVIPHLLVPELARAITTTGARRIAILNLEQEVGETQGFSPEQHLGALREQCPSLVIDTVIADTASVLMPDRLRRYAERVGSRVLLAPVAAGESAARHDPGRLSRVLAVAIGSSAGPEPTQTHGAAERRGRKQGVH